jgi:lipocalin
MKKIFLLAFVLGLLSACDATAKVDNSTVQSVDLSRYLGYWYEIAKYDHYFERDLDYAMAHYSLRDDGKIDVLNTGIKDGRAKDAKGIAKTTDVPGLLRVSFFGPFFGDYRIMMLDENYQYVLVGGSTDKYLWILSRTPELDEATKSLILAEADRRGYDTSKLIWVKQSAQ